MNQALAPPIPKEQQFQQLYPHPGLPSKHDSLDLTVMLSQKVSFVIDCKQHILKKLLLLRTARQRLLDKDYVLLREFYSYAQKLVEVYQLAGVIELQECLKELVEGLYAVLYDVVHETVEQLLFRKLDDQLHSAF